jgi:hypothetical protein
MGAEFAFQQLEQGLVVGWWFGWPQVPVGAADRRDALLVNDSQCPPVAGAFVTVTIEQVADGVGAAKLFGELLQAGARDRGLSLVAVSGGVWSDYLA